MTREALAAARAHFAPILSDLAATAVAREAERRLPTEEVRRLAAAGFGAVRLPVVDGGRGLSAGELVELLVDLGTADANLPQLWRNHVAFVEDRLWNRDREADGVWIDRIAAGAVVGGAWSERATVPGAVNGTRFDDRRRPATVTGTKYYSTGSLYADWITVTAKTPDDSDVLVVVDAHHSGVVLHDDWAGIGQRLTASGTTELHEVPVDPNAVFADGGRSPHQEVVYQLVLVAALAGVATAARDDAAAAVRARVRNYPQGLAAAPRDDAILQEVIGRVAAAAAAARAVVRVAAETLDDGLEALRAAASPDGAPELLHPASVATSEAQLVAGEEALRAATELYDALGSSAVERGSGLDRHWRNARTISSHNPRGYKARLLGDWYLSGTAPEPWARRHDPLPVPSESVVDDSEGHKTSPAEHVGNLS
ncbi:monooxygenase [Plantibacter flavus]|uniref:monooxygenase n=1 Tax=Plantibacter flavus TaxID=150123 RepID=UPI003F13E42F